MTTKKVRGMISIAGGTALYRSTIGYNNFYYPSDSLANIISDEEVEVMPWLNFNGKIPVKVRASNVSDTKSDTKYVVMWIG